MHTPTPWELERDHQSDRIYAIKGITRWNFLLKGASNQSQANAARIVLCVNSHDALVEALTKILNCPGDVNIQPALIYIRETARAALAKARVP